MEDVIIRTNAESTNSWLQF